MNRVQLLRLQRLVQAAASGQQGKERSPAPRAVQVAAAAHPAARERHRAVFFP